MILISSDDKFSLLVGFDIIFSLICANSVFSFLSVFVSCVFSFYFLFVFLCYAVSVTGHLAVDSTR
jgi:hypothetical protein